MTVFRPKLWTAVGAAALLAACTPGGEGGEKAGEGGEGGAPAGAPAGEGGEKAGGEGGERAGGEGGAGEAGAAGAYRNVDAESRSALRLAHLSGFFLIAQQVQKTEGDEAAAALAGQGMLEVFDPAKDAFAKTGVDEKALRDAAAKGDAASLQRALSALDAARAKVGGDSRQIVAGLVDIAAGLYGNVVADGAVDPIEYQHSLGAALSAKAEAARQGAPAEVVRLRPQIDGFVKLWPTPAAPADAAKATPVGKVRAEASRLQLELQ